MALRSKSLFLYGIQVTELNSSIDFRAVSLGPELQATLSLGYYSLTGLCDEIASKMTAADPTRIYTATVNRNVAGGLENRVTISTSGGYLDLLFASGTRAASSVRTLIGFVALDKTGATSYQGSSSSGTVLVSELVGYNYIPPEIYRRIFGSVNISASGRKEAIVFQTQQFWQVEFKHEPETKVLTEWAALMTWMTKQQPLEFTPEISSPTVFLEGTLESTDADSNGLAYTMKEELPSMPFYYQTGSLKFRKRVV